MNNHTPIRYIDPIFRPPSEAESLILPVTNGRSVQWSFLADGDSLVLPTRRLLDVLAAIREHLPAVRRISSYCLPRNLRRKSSAELRELADAGLGMPYVGAESGDDLVLEKVSKGETFARPARRWTNSGRPASSVP